MILPRLAEPLVRAALDRQAAVAAGGRCVYVATCNLDTLAAGIAVLIELASEPLRHRGPYDFGASDLVERVYVRGRDLFFEDAYSRAPDPATLFLHRKFVGTFMLCRRLRARVDLQAMTAAYF